MRRASPAEAAMATVVSIKACDPVSVPLGVLEELQQPRARFAQLRQQNERLRQDNDRLQQPEDFGIILV